MSESVSARAVRAAGRAARGSAGAPRPPRTDAPRPTHREATRRARREAIRPTRRETTGPAAVRREATRPAAERGSDSLSRHIDAALAALLPDHPRAALCVAFSGGLDSTALLAALAARLRRRGAARPGHGLSGSARREGLRLRAIHVDHRLRPSSGRAAEHCRAVAERLGVPLTVLRIDVRRARGASLEAAAREARYAALAAALSEGEVLLTAQHADDQLETVLLQLMRGAGVRGLAAMPALAPLGRGWLARPLLACDRRQIEAFARSRRLDWIEDEMNADERLDRNFLRRRVVPLLRERWPAASRAASRSARNAAEAQRLLDLIGRADAERAAVGDALCVKRLRALEPDRRRNALRYWIALRGAPLPDARRLLELAGPLIEARADAHPAVEWGGVVASREADRLSLARRDRASGGREARALDIEWLPARAAMLELDELGRLELISDPHGPVDLDLLPERLRVRLRRGGERLRLRHGGSSRALKALLQEARIPSAERACIPLVWSGERLLAAGDLWMDADIRAQPDSRRRGRLRWVR